MFFSTRSSEGGWLANSSASLPPSPPFFFDSSTKTLLGRRARIEVSSLDLGSQVLARRLPLLGIVYDNKSGIFEIALDGFEHLVREPREIYVDGPPSSWATLSVVDAGGALQIVTVTEPLMLPPAQRR